MSGRLGTSRSTCPSSTRFPRTTSGGGRGSPSGPTWSRHDRRFRGHEQPHLPADLGSTTCACPSSARPGDAGPPVRHRRVCYYHYWFGGQRAPRAPVRGGAGDRHPRPAVRCCAGPTRTGPAPGTVRPGRCSCSRSTTTHQREHARWLVEAFRDERYFARRQAPLPRLPRLRTCPTALGTTRLWRDEARAAGVGEIFLCRVESFGNERNDPTALGFDAAVEFAPDWEVLGSVRRRTSSAPRSPG